MMMMVMMIAITVLMSMVVMAVMMMVMIMKAMAMMMSVLEVVFPMVVDGDTETMVAVVMIMMMLAMTMIMMKMLSLSASVSASVYHRHPIFIRRHSFEKTEYCLCSRSAVRDNDDDVHDDGYLHANHCRVRVGRMPDMLRWKAFMLAVASNKQRCKACHQLFRCHALRYL